MVPCTYTYTILEFTFATVSTKLPFMSVRSRTLAYTPLHYCRFVSKRMGLAHGIRWRHFFSISDASLQLDNRTMRVNYTSIQRSTNPNADHMDESTPNWVNGRKHRWLRKPHRRWHASVVKWTISYWTEVETQRTRDIVYNRTGYVDRSLPIGTHFGDSATTSSRYPLTRPFTVEVRSNQETIYKSTLLHILRPSSLTIPFLTPNEGTQANSRRRASPLEAHFRRRKRAGSRWRKGRVSPQSKLISGWESFHH